MFLQKVKSIAELPATNPDKRSPSPARAVCESVPKICQTFLLSATMLLAPLNRILILNSFAASKCKKGSNASAIGDELSKLMRNIKMRQIS